MGIQDRDYYHDRHRYHAGISDRRDYSQRLREMEEAGQTINIEVEKPRRRFRILDGVRNKPADAEVQSVPASGGSYTVAFILVGAILVMLAFLGYRIIRALS
jgi:hypothetical protein